MSTALGLKVIKNNVNKNTQYKRRQPEMGCDGSRPADCSRRAVLRRRRRGPAPIVARRVAGTMRSADDAERRRRRDSALATGQMAFCS